MSGAELQTAQGFPDFSRLNEDLPTALTFLAGLFFKNRMER